MLLVSPQVVWPIAAISTVGVLVKPWRIGEAWWAAAGALAILLTGQLTGAETWHAVLQGTDVYLFLIGMMLIAELARVTGLFDWVAGHAVRLARGSPTRLFCLVYAVGIVVTVFMSNDATAVVLTPAVLAAAKVARLERPLPHLFACAMIANAASFVLPVSNPANLVLFAHDMPALGAWLRLFALPSLVAIGVTFLALYLSQRRDLAHPMQAGAAVAPLHPDARIVAAGIGATALALLAASAAHLDLGWPTCIAGVLAWLLVYARAPGAARHAARDLSWSVLVLVAGLFVLVAALTKIGIAAQLAQALASLQASAPRASVWVAGIGTALAANLANNLPAGLLTGATVAASHAPAQVTAAALIGINLGPNLSVSGSLATVLWLTALRREGVQVGFFDFLKVGLVVMPVALLLALAVL